jgi:hypothetical protein
MLAGVRVFIPAVSEGLACPSCHVELLLICFPLFFFLFFNQSA